MTPEDEAQKSDPVGTVTIRHPVTQDSETLARTVYGVTEMIYHIIPNEKPVSFDRRQERRIESDEQIWQRKGIVGIHWMQLDCGWVDQPFEVIITNEEGKFRDVMPSKNQIEDASRMLIEVSFSNPPQAACIVTPRWSSRFRPANLKTVMIRCPNGKAKFTIIAVQE